MAGSFASSLQTCCGEVMHNFPTFVPADSPRAHSLLTAKVMHPPDVDGCGSCARQTLCTRSRARSRFRIGAGSDSARSFVRSRINWSRAASRLARERQYRPGIRWRRDDRRPHRKFSRCVTFPYSAITADRRTSRKTGRSTGQARGARFGVLPGAGGTGVRLHGPPPPIRLAGERYGRRVQRTGDAAS